MTYFAKVHEGKVTKVIVAEQSFIDSYVDPAPGRWINTNNRKVSVGDNYDPIRERFVPQKPLPSWVLNESDLQWYPPKAYPSEGGPYVWVEDQLDWQLAPLNP
jgi:hypothetical protein